MADRSASNYSGKSGKTNVVLQGQTEGVYGSTVQMKRREGTPTDLKP
jgi:hypothetical protein